MSIALAIFAVMVVFLFVVMVWTDQRDRDFRSYYPEGVVMPWYLVLALGIMVGFCIGIVVRSLP